MTPATGQSLVDLMHGAGVPEALLRCVLGGPETGAELVAHDDVDGILFTGGSLTGLSISRALASKPDKLLAQHGRQQCDHRLGRRGYFQRRRAHRPVGLCLNRTALPLPRGGSS